MFLPDLFLISGELRFGTFLSEMEACPSAPDSEFGVGLLHVHSGGEVLEMADWVAEELVVW